MRDLLQSYRRVIKFILTFLLVYAVLSFTYKLYLDFSDGQTYYPDFMTNLVAKQSHSMLNTLGYTTEIIPHPDEPSIKLIVKDKYIARIIEGCNGMSVIILFIAFIVAFSNTFKDTAMYLMVGSVLIYSANLFRIVILAIGLREYPWRSEILHTVIFPGIIYGIVCLLWLVWVNRFSKLNTTDV